MAAGGTEIIPANPLPLEGPWYAGEEHRLWSQAGLRRIFVLLPVSSLSLEVDLTSLGLIPRSVSWV